MLANMKSTLGLGLALTLTAGLPIASAQLLRASDGLPHAQARPEFVPGRVLVKFRSMALPAAQQKAVEADALASVGGTVERVLRTPAAIRVVRVEDVLGAVRTLRANANVEITEPDYVCRANGLPNDTLFGQLWGLHNSGQSGGTPDADIDAPEAWNITVGSPQVVVAVIDSGISMNHADLAGKIWTNPGEIPGNGKDDDNNGYTDDVHGWDFENNDADPSDDNDHGTHVSGTIAAVGNNGQGVTGVAPQARVMALKFLDSEGYGSVSGAIEAMHYAVSMGCQISNHSYGSDTYSSALEDALRHAETAGHLVVASAGNDALDNDIAPSYPCSYDLSNIISVAASTRRDQLAWFSNIGRSSVDISAPGDSILSTVPGGSYDTFSGTSMAAPHVAGVAALVLSQFPGLPMEELRNRVLQSVRWVPALDGLMVAPGMVNAATALRTCPADVDRTGFLDTDDYTWFVQAFEQGDIAADFDRSGFVDTDDFTAFVVAFEDGCAAPLPPTGLTALLESGFSARLTWNANAADAILQRVEWTSDGTHSHVGAILDSQDGTALVGGLPELTTTTLRVVAVSEKGESASSAASVTTALGAPWDLEVASVFGNTVELWWLDGSKHETSQRVAGSTDGGSSWNNVAIFPADVTDGVVQDLKLDTPYHFKMRNASGSTYSEYSNTVFAITAPTAPGNLTACNVWADKVDLCWTDTSKTETEFRIAISRDGGATWDNVGVAPANTTSYRVHGLNPLTLYLFKVRGFNGYAYSEYSNTIQVGTTDIPPAAPSGLGVVNLWARKADLRWTDNSNNEANFHVEKSTDGMNFFAADMTGANDSDSRIDGLLPRTRYYFRVRASNNAGYSAYSNVITLDTPDEPPAAPSNLHLVNLWARKVDLRWIDNSNNESGFFVAVSIDGVTWGNAAVTGANDSDCRIDGLLPRNRYYFKVRAGNDAGYSDYSTMLTVDTPDEVPAAPSALVVANTYQTKIDLNWSDNADNESAYYVERSENGGASWSFVSKPLPPNSISFRDKDLTPNRTYHYRVRCQNAVGYSEYSDVTSGKTKA